MVAVQEELQVGLIEEFIDDPDILALVETYMRDKETAREIRRTEKRFKEYFTEARLTGKRLRVQRFIITGGLIGIEKEVSFTRNAAFRRKVGVDTIQ